MKKKKEKSSLNQIRKNSSISKIKSEPNVTLPSNSNTSYILFMILHQLNSANKMQMQHFYDATKVLGSVRFKDEKKCPIKMSMSRDQR